MIQLPHGPFACNGQSEVYYPSASHERARIEGLSCLGDGERVFLLEGPSGAGKTTLIRQILRHPGAAGEILTIPMGLSLNRRELLQALLFDCHLPMEGSEMELRLRLMDFVGTNLAQGRSVWITGDGAIGLGNDCFEELMLLTSMQGRMSSRVQLVIASDDIRTSRIFEGNDFQPANIVLEPWPMNELADLLKQRLSLIGMVTEMEDILRDEVLEALVPDKFAFPGTILGLARMAWRLGLAENAHNLDVELILQAREIQEAKIEKFKHESRWPLPQATNSQHGTYSMSKSEDLFGRPGSVPGAWD